MRKRLEPLDYQLGQDVPKEVTRNKSANDCVNSVLSHHYKRHNLKRLKRGTTRKE